MKTPFPFVFFAIKRSWRLLAIFATLVGLLMSPLPVGAENNNVNLYTGDSSYTLPIVTPPGANGVGPNLSLTYSSSGGDGMIGEGWSLQGLGSIERFGPNDSPTPSYNATDTYRLNFAGGGKLVCEKDVIGQCTSIYHTQIESFLRIEFISASNYWVVTDKGGTKYFFGQTPASQQNNPGDATRVFSWRLDKVLDVHGIFWTVSYDKDAVGGDIYPKQIVYTQGAGLACTPVNLTACNTVDFVLIPRPGGDSPISYRTGAKIFNDQIMQRINIKTGGNLSRAYTLTTNYAGNSPVNAGQPLGWAPGVGPRQTTQKTLLIEFREIGADGIALWTTNTFTYNTNWVDTPGNSYYNPVYQSYEPMLIQTTMTGSPTEGLGGAPQNPPTADNCTYTIDMNNDALPDILVGQAGNWFYYPNNGNGGFGAKIAVPNPVNSALPSLCVTTTEYRRATVWMVGQEFGPNGGFDTHLTYTPYSVSREIIQPVHDTALLDLDGDGFVDILNNPSPGVWYWFRGLGNGQFMDKALINPAGTALPILLGDKDVRLVDMDSDGLPDLVKLVMVDGTCIDAASTWRVDVYKNYGRDASGALLFSATPLPSGNLRNLQIHVDDPDSTPRACLSYSGPYPSSAFAFVDMNGDGLLDLVWFVRGKQSPQFPGATLRVWYYPNQGVTTGLVAAPCPVGTICPPALVPGTVLSFAPKVAIGGETNVGYEVMNQLHRWVDMNGDGLPDLLIGRGPSSTLAASYYYYPLSHYTVAGVNPNGYFYGRVMLNNFPPFDLTRENFLQVVDMDGDGYPDILQGNPGVAGGSGTYAYYWLIQRDNHQFLETAINPLGGTLMFDMQKLRSGNTIRWVTMHVFEGDGLGSNTSNESTYVYAGGKSVGWPQNEFRGYNTVAVDDPAVAGYSTQYTFYQDDAWKGRPGKIEKLSSGALFSMTTNTYATSAPVAGVSRVDLSAQVVDTYDGMSFFKTARTDYGLYDAYGNAHQVTISGTDIVPRVTSTDFVYNTAAYIVNRPSHTSTRITSATGAKISESWFGYDGQANGAAPTQGNLTRETHWLSGGVNPVLQYAYDAFGNRVGAIDAKANTCASTGYTSKTVYDTTYQTYPVSQTNALCQVTSKTYWGVNTALVASSVSGAYASPGQQATATDVNGARSDLYWDALNRPRASVIPPDNAIAPTTTWDYSITGLDLGGRLSAPSFTMESKLDSTAGTTLPKVTHVDGFGRTIQVKSVAVIPGKYVQWATQDTWYNTRGLVESVNVPYFTATGNFTSLDPSQPRTTTLYDAMRRPIKTTNPDGTFRTNAYTPYVVASTDEKSNTTTRTYDASQRLIQVVEPVGGGTTTYGYDSFDAAGNNTQQITDAAGNVVRSVFNTLGRKTSQTDPDLGIWSYTYDANGNMVTQRDAKLQTLTFVYDGLNRLATKTYPNTAKNSYLYDDPTVGTFRLGRLWRVSLTDPAFPASAFTTTYIYDARGRQVRVDKVAGVSSATTLTSYDSLDRIVNLTYPDGEVVNHSYNAQGLLNGLRSATYGLDYVVNVAYNAQGKVAQMMLGDNFFTTTYDYYDTAAKGPTSFRLRNVSRNLLQNLTYAYDNAGNIISITDALKTNSQTFGYDNLHRLTNAGSTVAPAYSHTYAYNAIGNVTALNATTYAYPAAGAARPHAPSGDGACTYSYDFNGSLINRICGATVRTFVWNVDNRLAQVWDGATMRAAFAYDHTGERVAKVEGATTTLIPFPHFRTVNGVPTKYYFANGERIAERSGPLATNVVYYHSDHLGSSNTVTDNWGSEIKATLFYPYGSTRAETGTKSLAFQYTGQEKDTATGLYNYGARFYDPAFMHFISADSIIPNAANPQTLNRYSYALNNPIIYTDPTGHYAYNQSYFPRVIGWGASATYGESPQGNQFLGFNFGIGKGSPGWPGSYNATGTYPGLPLLDSSRSAEYLSIALKVNYNFGPYTGTFTSGYFINSQYDAGEFLWAQPSSSISAPAYNKSVGTTYSFTIGGGFIGAAGKSFGDAFFDRQAEIMRYETGISYVPLASVQQQSSSSSGAVPYVTSNFSPGLDFLPLNWSWNASNGGYWDDGVACH